MLDKFVTPIIKPLLTPVVMLINKSGITANQLTVFGFLVGMFAVPLLAFEMWYGALIAIALNRILDGLDGALARYANQSSSAGGFLDITLDFLFYAAIPLGFILANPAQNAIAGAILLATFIGTGSSFLAFAIAAE
jgi:phosphatidylglycerophosphate synthase